MREHGDYSFNRLFYTSEKEILEIIDIKDILKIEGYCKEAEEAIKEIRNKLYLQTKKIQEVYTKKHIIITRTNNWYKKRIEIIVKIEEIKILGSYEKKEIFYETLKQFKGNEKKKALEYAEHLKKQYNLKIIKENWK